MNTQQNQSEIKKKGVQVNPSRDVKYDEKEKAFTGEFGDEDVKAADADNNSSKLDENEGELGEEQSAAQPSELRKQDKPLDTQKQMSSDLGGDVSQISIQGKNYPANKDQKGNDLH